MAALARTTLATCIAKKQFVSQRKGGHPSLEIDHRIQSLTPRLIPRRTSTPYAAYVNPALYASTSTSKIRPAKFASPPHDPS